MTYPAILKSLQRRGWFHIEPGLSRVRRVMDALGNPQDQIPSIHVAGTNGKGSVVASLESILRRSGYRTGLYISPHLKNIRERIQLGGRPISERVFAAAGRHVLACEKTTKTPLTSFEFLTVLAFVALAQAKPDILIIETGMGGLWDATNVLSHPLISLITSIGKDHTQWLGKTEKAIALQKAGIIKPRGLVISGVIGDGRAVIERVSRKKSARLLQKGSDFTATPLQISWSQGQQRILYHRHNQRPEEFVLSLLGSHQAHNASLVLAAVDELRRLGWRLSNADLRQGFLNVRWPGRFQLVSRRGAAPVIFDGAHNPPAMRNFIDTLQESSFAKTRKTFLFSAFRDKDYKAMAQLIGPLASTLLLCPLSGPRGLSVKSLAAVFRPYGKPLRMFSSPAAAMKFALAHTPSNEVIIVTGSLALVGRLLPESGVVKAVYA